MVDDDQYAPLADAERPFRADKPEWLMTPPQKGQVHRQHAAVEWLRESTPSP